MAPVSGSDRTVAYREFAKGQLCRLHNPVTLYSLRQKFWPFVVLKLVKKKLAYAYEDPRIFFKKKYAGKKKEKTNLSLKAQNCWLITCQTISSEAILKQSSMCFQVKIYGSSGQSRTAD